MAPRRRRRGGARAPAALQLRRCGDDQMGEEVRRRARSGDDRRVSMPTRTSRDQGAARRCVNQTCQHRMPLSQCGTAGVPARQTSQARVPESDVPCRFRVCRLFKGCSLASAVALRRDVAFRVTRRIPKGSAVTVEDRARVFRSPAASRRMCSRRQATRRRAAPRSLRAARRRVRVRPRPPQRAPAARSIRPRSCASVGEVPYEWDIDDRRADLGRQRRRRARRARCRARSRAAAPTPSCSIRTLRCRASTR